MLNMFHDIAGAPVRSKHQTQTDGSLGANVYRNKHCPAHRSQPRHGRTIRDFKSSKYEGQYFETWKQFLQQ